MAPTLLNLLIVP